MGNCLGQCLAGKSGLRTDDDEQEQLVDTEESNENFIFKIIKFRKKRPSEFLEKFWERQCQTYSRLSKERIPHDSHSSSDIQLQCLDAQNLMLSSRDVPVMPTHFKSTGYHEYGIPTSSRASSSLDLEWEHEYSAVTNNVNSQLSQSWFFLSEEDAQDCNEQDDLIPNDSVIHPKKDVSPYVSKNNLSTVNSCSEIGGREINVGHSTKNSWSHISTPESLEWDIDEDQQKRMNVEDDMLDHDTLQLLHEIEQLKNKVLEETGSGLDFEVVPRPEES